MTDLPPPPAGAGPHPVTELDDLVHQRVRLGVLAITAESPRVEFTYLREVLQLTAGNLSRHLAALTGAGLLHQDKAGGQDAPAGARSAGRRRTWLRITPAGRAALQREVDALRALLTQVEGTAPARTRTTAVEGARRPPPTAAPRSHHPARPARCRPP